MLAIALVLDGVDRKTAAENCGMDRQTLRDWAHRYNAEGVSGLFNRRPPDPPCLLSAAQKEELAEMVRAGPDPETDGVVRWRRIDLKRKIEERFGVTMSELLLASLGFRRLSARRIRNPTRMHRRLLKETLNNSLQISIVFPPLAGVFVTQQSFSSLEQA